MIIDSHTHIFPDKVADTMFAHLLPLAPDDLHAHTDATKKGLLASMKKNGIDYSVVLPIVTAPHQFDSINRFAAKINGHDGLISFGGIHPDNTRIREKLSYIKSLGLPGVKLHPDDQKTFIDDPRYIEIIRTCVELDLHVTIHAGVDVGFPDPVYCPPVRAAHMLDLVYGKKHPDKAHITLAHIGGNDLCDVVERCLVGRNVYFDLAFSLDRINKVQLLRIIQNHGADRILWASDSPWADQGTYRKLFDELPLFDDERELILWKNAAKMLGIPV